MTVTPDQWALVAADNDLDVEVMHIEIDRIDRIDGMDEVAKLTERKKLPPTMFDRDGDPLTLGQWAMLHRSTSYRFVRETILPNRYWIVTIWQGVNEAYELPPVIFGTAAFHLTDTAATKLPPSVWHLAASSEAEALHWHDSLIDIYRNAHLNEETELT